MLFFAYLCRMEIPKAVLAAAGELVDMFGPSFSLLGELDGAQFYLFEYPEDEKTGFPFVYQFKEGEPVLEITDFEALEIIRLFDVE